MQFLMILYGKSQGLALFSALTLHTSLQAQPNPNNRRTTPSPLQFQVASPPLQKRHAQSAGSPRSLPAIIHNISENEYISSSATTRGGGGRSQRQKFCHGKERRER
ncbi:hypothetical protein HOY82DRAFT_548942 [Tuber indicum]|nr:hypothetical protein HOY82DRAFT_548942 [Tuber indicum]